MTTVPDPTLALTDPDAEGIDGLGDAVQPGDAVRDPSDDGVRVDAGDLVREPRGEGDTVRVIPLADAPGV
jgi:hypothetical protein